MFHKTPPRLAGSLVFRKRLPPRCPGFFAAGKTFYPTYWREWQKLPIFIAVFFIG
jgi:hypothetical protein